MSSCKWLRNSESVCYACEFHFIELKKISNCLLRSWQDLSIPEIFFWGDSYSEFFHLSGIIFAFCVIREYFWHNFFEKQLCVFFTPIDSSHYSVHKSIEIQLPKKWIVYEVFYISCKILSIHISKNIQLKGVSLQCFEKFSRSAIRICNLILTLARHSMKLIRSLNRFF